MLVNFLSKIIKQNLLSSKKQLKTLIYCIRKLTSLYDYNERYIASIPVFLTFFKLSLKRIIKNFNKPTILAILKPLSQLLSELDIMLIMKQFTSIDNIGYFNYYVATYNNLDKRNQYGKN